MSKKTDQRTYIVTVRHWKEMVYRVRAETEEEANDIVERGQVNPESGDDGRDTDIVEAFL